MNLYVGNLLPNVSENDLKSFFEQFGQVRDVHLITNRHSNQSNGYGFVEMPSKDEAEKAIDEMNGKEFMGRIININPAKSKVNRRRGSSRSQDFTDRRQKRRY